MAEFFVLDREPVRQGLPLVIALGGIIDAGQAASVFGTHLTTTMEAERIGGFNSDALFDYRQHRGAARLMQGRYVMATLPGISLFEVTDAAGSPMLLLSGPEPDFGWLQLTSKIAELVERFDVPLVVYVGAVPWAAPHTRPVGIIGHGTNRMVLARYPGPTDDLTVPVTITALVEMSVAGAGRDVLGFVAKVPQYVANERFEPAVGALAAAVGPAIGLQIPPVSEGTSEVLARLDRQAATFPPLRDLIAAFEHAYDEHDESGAMGQLPSGDELAAQIEEYLAEQ